MPGAKGIPAPVAARRPFRELRSPAETLMQCRVGGPCAGYQSASIRVARSIVHFCDVANVGDATAHNHRTGEERQPRGDLIRTCLAADGLSPGLLDQDTPRIRPNLIWRVTSKPRLYLIFVVPQWLQWPLINDNQTIFVNCGMAKQYSLSRCRTRRTHPR